MSTSVDRSRRPVSTKGIKWMQCIGTTGGRSAHSHPVRLFPIGRQPTSMELATDSPLSISQDPDEGGGGEDERVGSLNVTVPLTLSGAPVLQGAPDIISSPPRLDRQLHSELGSSEVSENIPSSPQRSREGRSEGERSAADLLTTTTSALVQETPRRHVQLPNLAQQALDRLANASRQVQDSPDDFRPLKKRRIHETSAQNTDDEDKEGQTCSICFEPWSNSGGHRIASLKCGHIFGQNCIEKWLKGQATGKCPQCNAKAKKSDIRPIYAKAITVVDTTERDRALEELKEERILRIAAQKAEAQAILQHQLAKAECERSRLEIKQLRQQLEYYVSGGAGVSDACTVIGSDPTGDRVGKYAQHQTILVSQAGGARVVAHDPRNDLLVASKPSGNHLYPGYGLMKISTLEPRYSEFVSIHGAAIRDVAFNPREDKLVATAGTDRCLKLTSLHSNTVVQSYQTASPAWACTWNQDDTNYVYCGLQNGSLLLYDIRNTSDHVTKLQRTSGSCPVTSLSHVPLCRASTLNCSGILVGTLKGAMFWEKSFSSDDYTQHELTSLPEGVCTCVSFEPVTRHCLASFRPSKRSPVSKHLLCQLHNVPSDKPFSCQVVHQFIGTATHKLLSRSKLIQKPGGVDTKILAVFGEESTKMVQVWDASTTSKIQDLSLEGSAALDLVQFSQGPKDYLAILTDSKLFVCQWRWG